MKITDTFTTTGGITHEVHLTGADCLAIVAAPEGALFPWLVAPARSEVKHSTDARAHTLFGGDRYPAMTVLRMARVSQRDYEMLLAVTG